MVNDFSYEKIKQQLRVDYDHVLTMIKLTQDSNPDTVAMVGYYCRGVLNATRPYWEHTEQQLVWTALYVKVDKILSMVIKHTSIESSLEPPHKEEYRLMKNNPAYLDQVLASFCSN